MGFLISLLGVGIAGLVIYSIALMFISPNNGDYFASRWKK